MWLLLVEPSAVSETVSIVAFEVEVIALVEHTPRERTTYTDPETTKPLKANRTLAKQQTV